MSNSIVEQEVFLFSDYKNKKWSTTKVVIGRPQKMLEQTTVEVIAINDHRKCHRGDHTTVIVIMPIKILHQGVLLCQKEVIHIYKLCIQ